MLTLTIKESKKFFFDEAKIRRSVRKAQQEQRALRRAGAFIRRTARSSMRKVKKRTTVSSPGQPPRSHSSEPNLRTIFYIYDPQTTSMVVGPPLLPSSKNSRDSLPVPGLHEHGGTAHRTVYADASNRPAKFRKKKRAAIRLAKRPFMLPALEQNADKIPPLWRDSVR